MKSHYVKVKDDFLDENYLKYLQKIMMGYDMPWYSNPITHMDDTEDFQFTHKFFDLYDGGLSTYFPHLEPLVTKMNIKKLYRIKANLELKTFFKRKRGYHTDFDNITTSVFYLNTNNGGTKFKGGKFVKSVANRLVTFDSNLIHTGVSCTDKKRRFVINLNYEGTTI